MVAAPRAGEGGFSRRLRGCSARPGPLLPGDPLPPRDPAGSPRWGLGCCERHLPPLATSRAPRGGLTPPLSLLQPAAGTAQLGLAAAHSFTASHCLLEKGGACRLRGWRCWPWASPASLPTAPPQTPPPPPPPRLPCLYGRQSANSQRREVGQSLRPRGRLFTASGGSWLQRSGGLALQ